MKRNTKFIKKWIEALRSGKYKKGRAALKLNESYCCLGVAACVLPEYMNAKFNGYGELSLEGVDFKVDSALPEKILDYIGITEIEQQDLIQRNDNKDHSFNKIALYLGTLIVQAK